MRHILSFALPIIAGNLLQQMYQIAASIIVGRYCGENSLAAMGVATPVVSLAVFFMIGIGLGLTVLLSKYFGEGDLERFREIAYTARRAGLLFALALVGLAMLCTHGILVLSATPAEIMGETSLYLYIIFLGLPLTFLYNYYSSAFLSIGKSQIPFFALAISSIINILLSLLLVAVLGIGIIGAAIANVVAQSCSVLFCVLYTKKKTPLLVFGKGQVRFDKRYLKEIVAYSIVSAIQQIIFIVGRLIVQRGVNVLGVSTIAGYNAAANLESLVIAPADGISAAIASLIAVEYGRRHLDGITAISKCGLKLCLSYSLLLAVGLWLISPFVIPLFLEDASAVMVATGVTYLRYMFFAYAVISGPEILQAFFRGTGQIKITLIATVIQIVIRVVMTYALLYTIGIKAVSLATATGWAVMSIYLGIVLARRLKRLAAEWSAL